HGSDGKTVGRGGDSYFLDPTGASAPFTVLPRQSTARTVLIPASPIAAWPGCPEDEGAPPPAAAGTPADEGVRLLVDTATAQAGVRPPHTLHATPEDLREAAAALRLGEGSARA